jgi:hypothetical protein
MRGKDKVAIYSGYAARRIALSGSCLTFGKTLTEMVKGTLVDVHGVVLIVQAAR